MATDDAYADDFEAEDAGAPWQSISLPALVVGKQLGGGGFAVVYAGTYKGKPVAIKMIVDPSVTPAQTAEFMSELQTMGAVCTQGHPHLVTLVGANAVPPKQCIVMQLCGRSLFSLLHGDGETPPASGLDMPRRLAFAIHAARALCALHAHKPAAVIHRDVKSLNLLLDASGALRLADFGLVGCANATAGTPAYMAPELLADTPYSKSVDTYAYGVLLWEMFARSIPYAGWRPMDIVAATLAGQRLDVAKLQSGTPSVIVDLIPACTHATPSRRPDMTEVLSRLEAWRPPAAATAGGDALDALAAATKRPAAGARGSSAGHK